jgi:hypothetical protein
MIGKHGLDWASKEEEAKWHVIQLPDHLFYSEGRDEYLRIMHWLEKHCGVIATDWDQHILKRVLFFKHEDDLVAFKLAFRV